ncbi:hypothetical protein NPIL_504001 [Nephila pilipes]|uniref:Uncharacterized protein n=1 Tax=Nephila pilipes TaxID=299642 RepID=A0A8X6MMU1_NEPPI|nr:hypothetical protein NPIL_283841 [Nephila pilipes]GFT22732.1 hypothetical protein NPIL_504001 [Nephila pilipes]
MGLALYPCAIICMYERECGFISPRNFFKHGLDPVAMFLLLKFGRRCFETPGIVEREESRVREEAGSSRWDTRPEEKDLRFGFSLLEIRERHAHKQKGAGTL